MRPLTACQHTREPGRSSWGAACTPFSGSIEAWGALVSWRPSRSSGAWGAAMTSRDLRGPAGMAAAPAGAVRPGLKG